MPDYEQMSLGKGLESVALRVSELQREMSALRRDVKLILHLLSETKARGAEAEMDPRENEGE